MKVFIDKEKAKEGIVQINKIFSKNEEKYDDENNYFLESDYIPTIVTVENDLLIFGYYIVIENNKFKNFTEEKTEHQISYEEYKWLIEKQKEGFTLYWNIKKKQLDAVKLKQFEYVNDNGEIIKDIEEELEYYKVLIFNAKKEKIQLKKDILDFEEFEEDTTYLKEQLKEKEAEIKEMEEKIKSSEK